MATKARDAPWRVELNHEWCKACGLCVESCPKKVFGTGADGRAEVRCQDSCVGCNICDQLCPDLAIEVYPDGGDDE